MDRRLLAGTRLRTLRQARFAGECDLGEASGASARQLC